MRNFYRKILYLVAFLPFCSWLFAQENDTVVQLKHVNIQAYPYKEVSPAQILKGEELQQLNSHNVADALRYFSGVQIKDYGGIGGLKTVNIRSMGSQHVGVFYDGIQLGNAQNGTVDLGRFSLDDMEMISLYNGQKSQIFQSAKDFGSAGSIYLNTKKPTFIANKKTNLKVGYKLGSIQLINPSIRIEHKISPTLSAALSSELIKSNGIYSFRYRRTDQQGNLLWSEKWKRRDASIEAKRLEATVFGKVENGLWDLKSYNYLSDREIPGAVVKGHDEILTGPTLTDRNHYIQGNFQKKWTGFETHFRGKFAYDYTHYVTRDTTRLMLDNTYVQREIYASTSNLYRINPQWDISFAYDFQYNTLSANLRDFSYPTRYSNLFALATAYQNKHLKAQASLLGTFVQESVKKNAAAPDKNIWTPALFLSYQPFLDKDFHLRAFYKKIFRMPTFNDLYYTEIGYTLLKPEYTTQYNLGLAYNLSTSSGWMKNLSTKLDVYYNEVKDKIVAMPGNNNFRWMMVNLGEVRIKGLDANVKTDFRFRAVDVSTLLTYTFQKAQDYTYETDLNGNSYPSALYKDQIPYTPKHSGSAVVSSAYQNWRLNYSFIYVGKRYNSLRNNIKINEVNPWFTHDISVQKDFKINNYQLRLMAEVQNLLNQQYEVVIYYPMPGTNVRFTIQLEL
ncbi:TonB-dependent receptor [Weeksella virosa]|uniref:TonB-dependent receptor n=1 Tax=Weeksella virosa TaxID=1014 RepID=UPI002556AA05|nr:TonB-dependent receptor [Weeksella virosa]MDK7675209.1 TonB-dependent receptor [Weeksella virosa]